MFDRSALRPLVPPLRRVLLAGAVLLVGCGSEAIAADGGGVDAESIVDSGSIDVGAVDSAGSDGSSSDAGTVDGSVDGGWVDASPGDPDAGPRAPTPLCAGAAAMPGEIITSIAFDSTGAVIVAGTSGGNDGFVESFDASCAFSWRVLVGGSGTQSVASVSVAADRSIYVAISNIGGTLGLPDGSTTSDLFALAKLGSDGTVLWLHGHGTTSYPVASAPSSSGGVVLVGLFQGSLGFGGGAMVTAPISSTQLFAASLDADGVGEWAIASSGTFTSPPAGLAVAIDPDGDVLLAGVLLNSGNTIDLGGGPLTASPGFGNSSIWAAKLSGASGTHAWSRAFDDAYSVRIASDLVGNLVLAAGSQAGADFGMGTATGLGVAFVSLAANTGAPRWSHFQEGSVPASAAAGPDGALFVGLHVLSGGTDFGGGVIGGGGPLGTRPAVAILDADGRFIGGEVFGPGVVSATYVTAGPRGTYAMATSICGSLDVGFGPVVNPRAALCGSSDPREALTYVVRFED